MRPRTVEEAARLAAAGDTKLLAGGMSLLPTHQAAAGALRRAGRSRRPSTTCRASARRRCARHRRHDAPCRGRRVRRGARVRFRRWRSLAGGIGDPLVRNRGTIGGSIANADPAADYPAAVLGLGATVITDRREIAGDDFFTGLVRDRAGAGRDHHARCAFRVPQQAGYAKFPQPGVALRASSACSWRRPRRRARRGHRRGPIACSVRCRRRQALRQDFAPSRARRHRRSMPRR